MVWDKIIIMLVMLVHSITDIRYKKVMGQLILLGIFVGIIFQGRDIWNGTWEYAQIVALCPGILCLVLAKITKEAIGYGDGMILFMLGFFYKWETLCVIVMEACMLAAVVALVLLTVFRKNRKYEIPFVPFLTLALFVEELCG
mgnify:CR=1 FL=1